MIGHPMGEYVLNIVILPLAAMTFGFLIAATALFSYYQITESGAAKEKKGQAKRKAEPNPKDPKVKAPAKRKAETKKGDDEARDDVPTGGATTVPAEKAADDTELMHQVTPLETIAEEEATLETLEAVEAIEAAEAVEAVEEARNPDELEKDRAPEMALEKAPVTPRTPETQCCSSASPSGSTTPEVLSPPPTPPTPTTTASEENEHDSDEGEGRWIDEEDLEAEFEDYTEGELAEHNKRRHAREEARGPAQTESGHGAERRDKRRSGRDKAWDGRSLLADGKSVKKEKKSKDEKKEAAEKESRAKRLEELRERWANELKEQEEQKKKKSVLSKPLSPSRTAPDAEEKKCGCAEEKRELPTPVRVVRVLQREEEKVKEEPKQVVPLRAAYEQVKQEYKRCVEKEDEQQKIWWQQQQQLQFQPQRTVLRAPVSPKLDPILEVLDHSVLAGHLSCGCRSAAAPEFAKVVAAITMKMRFVTGVRLRLPRGEAPEMVIEVCEADGADANLVAELATTALLEACQLATGVYAQGYMTKDVFWPHVQGLGAIVGHVPAEDESKCCWEMHQKGYCPRGNNCRWKHSTESLALRISKVA